MVHFCHKLLLLGLGCSVTFQLVSLYANHDIRSMVMFVTKQLEMITTPTATLLSTSDTIPEKEERHKEDNTIYNKFSHQRNVVVTSPGKQGYHLPRGLVEWNLSSSTKNYTKTIFTTCCRDDVESFPTFSILEIFNSTRLEEWTVILPNSSSASDDPLCENSLIRAINYGSSKKAQVLNPHTSGEQLTSRLWGTFSISSNKDRLYELILSQNSTNYDNNEILRLLQNSIPRTRNFASSQQCHEFCNNEWFVSQQQKQKQQWIWKPKHGMEGQGIVLIGGDKTTTMSNGNDNINAALRKMDLESCHRHCSHQDSSTSFQAQVLFDAMRLPDDRKFDIRTHILIANVNPLVVFTGAEVIRICAEPMNSTNPTPFPNKTFAEDNSKNNNEISTPSSWNPYQQVCNAAIGQQHPVEGVWSYQNNTGPIDMAIKDKATSKRIIDTLDKHSKALIKHIIQPKIKGKVGMFQIMGSDYILDRSEKLWLLEINSRPVAFSLGEGATNPNPWGDIFQIEWTILEIYHQHYRTSDPSYWEPILYETLSKLELETLRMMMPPI